MQMTGEYRVPAPREQVWNALNDVEVLRQCLPGIEEIERKSETDFDAIVRAKVGPVSARFSGSLNLTDLDPPNGYRISGEGRGGAAGFAKGGAWVTLREDEGATLLRYELDAKVGGKIAQVGTRVIGSTARKMADDFFARFVEAVAALEQSPAIPDDGATRLETGKEVEMAGKEKHDGQGVTPTPVEVNDSDIGAGADTGVWVTALLCVVLILLAIFAL